MKHLAQESGYREQLAQLRLGMDMLGISLSSRQWQQLSGYLFALLLQNQKMNLFSRWDLPRLAERHLLECFAWFPIFAEQMTAPVMDLGSGAGLPGIPLSISRPALSISLVESVKKKARFLEEIVQQQGLNARVYAVRAEELARQDENRGQYGLIVARAVASIHDLLAWAAPLLAPGAGLLTFKGDKLAEEIDALKKRSLNIRWRVEKFRVPKDLATQPGWQNRHALWVQFE